MSEFVTLDEFLLALFPTLINFRECDNTQGPSIYTFENVYDKFMYIAVCDKIRSNFTNNLIAFSHFHSFWLMQFLFDPSEKTSYILSWIIQAQSSVRKLSKIKIDKFFMASYVVQYIFSNTIEISHHRRMHRVIEKE